jgi:hypothetical protein
MTSLHESEAKQSLTTAMRDRSPAEPHSIRRMLCPPGYLCRIARMQASDHLSHPAKFSETGEKIAISFPSVVSLPM